MSQVGATLVATTPGATMELHQSDLTLWQRCPLQWRYEKMDGHPSPQSSALTFGTIVHYCVMRLEQDRDLDAAVTRFQELWTEPSLLDPELAIQEWLKGQSWTKLRDQGVRILTNWWGIVQWMTDVVVAREHPFRVPFGNHILVGTVDKVLVRYNPQLDGYELVVSDYKTNRKRPTYDYLSQHLQFTAYSAASLHPEFWTGIENGEKWHEHTKNMPRRGEWVHLQTPRRLDAGPRTDMHYNRLRMAVDAMARSVAADIYVPNISGETCSYCPFREKCGLDPEYMT